MKAQENHENMLRDSDTIFTAVSQSMDNWEEAQRIVVIGYVMDETFSRAGISHALKRLEKFYQEKS